MEMLEIKIDEKKCNNCQLCIDACPIPCYEVERETGKVRVAGIYLTECLVCKNCEEICPTKAITVKLTHRHYLDSTW